MGITCRCTTLYIRITFRMDPWLFHCLLLFYFNGSLTGDLFLWLLPDHYNMYGKLLGFGHLFHGHIKNQIGLGYVVLRHRSSDTNHRLNLRRLHFIPLQCWWNSIPTPLIISNCNKSLGDGMIYKTKRKREMLVWTRKKRPRWMTFMLNWRGFAIKRNQANNV